jgi:ABC-type antimicrobial peptide transport system permease subunit
LIVTQIKPSKFLLKIDVYNYYSSEPIKELSFQMNVTTKENEKIHVSASSGDNGTTIIDLPLNTLSSSDLSITQISFSGIWVLEKIISEKEYYISDGKWSIINPEKFPNATDYILSDIHFLKEKGGASTVFFKLKIFLAEGRVIEIFNPINEALKIDPRIKIKLLFLNFIEFRNINLAVVPIREPLTINILLTYVDFSWNINISYDPNEKTFVDLTSLVIRSLSISQVNSLREMLEVLEPYGFRLAELYSRLNQISLYHEQAAQYSESHNYEEAIKYLYMAQRSYYDIYTQIINIYTSIISWSPTLIIILIFFAFSLSRILTERKMLANVIFLLLFFLCSLIFLLTHQGFKFFILGFHHILQKITMPSLIAFSFQIFQIIFVIFIIFIFMFSDLRDMISQTFGISIKNLRRRRARTLLALAPLALISASAMCLLTFTSMNPIYWAPSYHLKPKVNNGLVIYKQLIATTRSYFTSGSGSTVTHYIPLQPYEVSLFMGDWVELINIYGIKKVYLGSTIFNIIIINQEFMEKYMNESEVLDLKWSNLAGRNMILIGSRIASLYNLTEGSEVLIDSRKFIVKDIFDEEKIAEFLKEIDGDYFLFNIYDSVNKKIINESFIFASIKDFSIQEIEIYKISIVLKSEYMMNMTNIVNDLASLGFSYWETETATFMQRYLINAIFNGSLLHVSPESSVITLFGNWQDHIVPLIIASLVLFMNTLSIISERTSEIHTLFAIGASPRRVSLIFIIEGLTLGIMGGIFGYIIGYIMTQITNLTLPSSVQKNLISVSPFTVAFSISIITSVSGCLIPSRMAVKVAVPSRVISKKIGDIVRIEDEEAALEVPIKLQEKEMKSFHVFLESLMRIYDGKFFKEIIFDNLLLNSLADESVWSFRVKYSGDYHVNFQICITAKENRDIKIKVKPLDAISGKIARWETKYEDSLKKIAPILRKELLKFLTFEGKIKTLES